VPEDANDRRSQFGPTIGRFTRADTAAWNGCAALGQSMRPMPLMIPESVAARREDSSGPLADSWERASRAVRRGDCSPAVNLFTIRHYSSSERSASMTRACGLPARMIVWESTAFMRRYRMR
jgi:hypothetical protein